MHSVLKTLLLGVGEEQELSMNNSASGGRGLTIFCTGVAVSILTLTTLCFYVINSASGGRGLTLFCTGVAVSIFFCAKRSDVEQQYDPKMEKVLHLWEQNNYFEGPTLQVTIATYR